MKHYKYLILLIISASFLMSQVGQVPNKKGYPSPINSKKKAVIKAGENDDLKSELIELENSFKDQHASIKSGYKERISALKEQQKAEVQELKKNYNFLSISEIKKKKFSNNKLIKNLTSTQIPCTTKKQEKYDAACEKVRITGFWRGVWHV